MNETTTENSALHIMNNDSKQQINRLNNLNVDLKNTNKDLNKKLVNALARVRHLENGIVDLANHQKRALQSFEKKHRKCIDDILEIVENPNFVTFPDADRRKVVELEYRKILVNGQRKEA